MKAETNEVREITKKASVKFVFSQNWIADFHFFPFAKSILVYGGRRRVERVVVWLPEKYGPETKRRNLQTKSTN